MDTSNTTPNVSEISLEKLSTIMQVTVSSD